MAASGGILALLLADLGKRLVLPLLDGGTVVIPVNGVAVVVLPFDFELFVFALFDWLHSQSSGVEVDVIPVPVGPVVVLS